MGRSQKILPIVFLFECKKQLVIPIMTRYQRAQSMYCQKTIYHFFWTAITVILIERPPIINLSVHRVLNYNYLYHPANIIIHWMILNLLQLYEYILVDRDNRLVYQNHSQI